MPCTLHVAAFTLHEISTVVCSDIFDGSSRFKSWLISGENENLFSQLTGATIFRESHYIWMELSY